MDRNEGVSRVLARSLDAGAGRVIWYDVEEEVVGRGKSVEENLLVQNPCMARQLTIHARRLEAYSHEHGHIYSGLWALAFFSFPHTFTNIIRVYRRLRYVYA